MDVSQLQVRQKNRAIENLKRVVMCYLTCLLNDRWVRVSWSKCQLINVKTYFLRL